MLNLLGVICALAAGALQVSFSEFAAAAATYLHNPVLAFDGFDIRQPRPRFRHIWFSREQLLSIATIQRCERD